MAAADVSADTAGDDTGGAPQLSDNDSWSEEDIDAQAAAAAVLGSISLTEAQNVASCKTFQPQDSDIDSGGSQTDGDSTFGQFIKTRSGGERSQSALNTLIGGSSCGSSSNDSSSNDGNSDDGSSNDVVVCETVTQRCNCTQLYNCTGEVNMSVFFCLPIMAAHAVHLNPGVEPCLVCRVNDQGLLKTTHRIKVTAKMCVQRVYEDWAEWPLRMDPKRFECRQSMVAGKAIYAIADAPKALLLPYHGEELICRMQVDSPHGLEGTGDATHCFCLQYMGGRVVNGKYVAEMGMQLSNTVLRGANLATNKKACNFSHKNVESVLIEARNALTAGDEVTMIYGDKGANRIAFGKNPRDGSDIEPLAEPRVLLCTQFGLEWASIEAKMHLKATMKDGRPIYKWVPLSFINEQWIAGNKFVFAWSRPQLNQIIGRTWFSITEDRRYEPRNSKIRPATMFWWAATTDVSSLDWDAISQSDERVSTRNRTPSPSPRRGGRNRTDVRQGTPHLDASPHAMCEYPSASPRTVSASPRTVFGHHINLGDSYIHPDRLLKANCIPRRCLRGCGKPCRCPRNVSFITTALS
jgi:hypothetical protein